MRAVTDFPTPLDLCALRGFLGLTSYYRRFIPRYSARAQPLYQLTRKDAPFEWTTECSHAFNRLKSALTEAPVLAYPRFGHPFLLETDASGAGLGAVLSQKQEDGTTHSIAYVSRTLPDDSSQASTGESPFFLVYGRDPRLPTATVLTPPKDPQVCDLDDYKSTLVKEMSAAWSRARECVERAQKRQKRFYDQSKRNSSFVVGDRVFVCMPAKRTGHMQKLACPFQGPYRVMEVYPNGLDVCLVEKPGSPTIRIAMDRARYCPPQISDTAAEGGVPDGHPKKTPEEEDPGEGSLDPDEADPGANISPSTAAPEKDETSSDRSSETQSNHDDGGVGGSWKGRLSPRHLHGDRGRSYPRAGKCNDPCHLCIVISGIVRI